MGRTVLHYVEKIDWVAAGVQTQESNQDLGFLHEALCTLYGEQAPPFSLLRKAKNDYHTGTVNRLRRVTELAEWLTRKDLDFDKQLPPASKPEVASEILERLLLLKESALEQQPAEQILQEGSDSDAEAELELHANLDT